MIFEGLTPESIQPSRRAVGFESGLCKELGLGFVEQGIY